MGQLARRIDQLLREHGLDPSAWQGEVQSLASLEEKDPKAAQGRFHDLKRALLVMRRGHLLRELRSHPFVADAPPSDAKGYDVRELEREIRWATASVRHARVIADAVRIEADARASLQERPLLAPPAPAPRRWDDLAPLEAEADLARRRALRELRVEEETRDLARRAAKLERLRVDLPDTRPLEAEAALAALEAPARELREAEAIEAAHARAVAPLRKPHVREFKAQTRRELEREADARLAARDLVGLEAVRARADALDREAAAVGSQAARARRAGVAAPRGERRPGDAMDGYG